MAPVQAVSTKDLDMTPKTLTAKHRSPMLESQGESSVGCRCIQGANLEHASGKEAYGSFLEGPANA